MEQTDNRREIAYLQYLLRYMLVLGGKMYTIEDIFALPDGERAELIDGEMFMMATPTWTHQGTVMWLSNVIYNYIRENGGKCKVCPSPFGIFLKNDNRNYVEPDISVICNRDKLDEKGVSGAPDWVVEIVSPSSREMDYRRKLVAYKEADVREYWIIDPAKEEVVVYHFEEKEDAVTYCYADTIPSQTLKGLSVPFLDLKKYLYE